MESSKRVMIIEEPVGTEKLLGALVPVLVDQKYNTFDKGNVMYAIATINLQGPLMRSEMPFLCILGLVNNPIVAKGKSHQVKKEKNNYFRVQFNMSWKSFFGQVRQGKRAN